MDASRTELPLVPAACTLPTSEQPLRLAELDDLLAQHVRSVRRDSTTRVTLELTPEAHIAAAAADLAVRETACCSFFAFDLHVAEGALSLSVSAGEAHGAVLASLADRAEQLAGVDSEVTDR
jgi:hypothetical protein